MEYIQENSTENAEIPNELPQNTELPSMIGDSEQEISSVSEEMPSIYGLDGGQLSVQHSDLNVLALNSSEQVLNEDEGILSPPLPVLNSLIPVLNDNEQVLNAIKPVLKSEFANLNAIDTDLNSEAGVLSIKDEVLNPPVKLAELPLEKEYVKPLNPELAKIFQYVKAQPQRGDKVVLKPVGIDEALFNELMLITKQGGIAISRYCSEVLRHHEDVLGLQLMKNELSDIKQLYNEAVNENLRISMDKKTVEDSEKLLVNISQSHLDSKESLQLALDEKQAELNRANATIDTLKKGMDKVSESVQEAYQDYLVNILPETLAETLKIVHLTINNRDMFGCNTFDRSFDTFEELFYNEYQRNMALITKQQEIKKLAKAKNNE